MRGNFDQTNRIGGILTRDRGYEGFWSEIGDKRDFGQR